MAAPENHHPMIPICGAVLIATCNGAPHLLLGKRTATRRSYPGVWDVIGGHVEAGETAEQALVRELGEEIGVTPVAWWEVARIVVPASGPDSGAGAGPEEARKALDFRLYAVTAWSGTPRNLQPEEHEEIAWFGLEDACGLCLAHPAYPELFRRSVGGFWPAGEGGSTTMETTPAVRTVASLDEVRAEIDRIDAALIALLAERAAYVRQAAGFKRTEAEARATARVEAVVARVRERAAAAGLPPDVAERTWRAMIAAFVDAELAEIAARPGTGARPSPGGAG